MSKRANDWQTQLLTLASSWNRLERRLDASLAGVRGISFAEYRLLNTLARSPAGSLSRVELAQAVGLTPSGVTRALRPLEKLRIVKTIKSERDARLALACLTPAGEELVADASAVIDDHMASLMERVPGRSAGMGELLLELERR